MSYLQEWPDTQDRLVQCTRSMPVHLCRFFLVTAAAAVVSLWQSFQNGVDFFSYSGQSKLKLVLRSH